MDEASEQIAAIVAYIEAYRAAGWPAAMTLEAVLGAFPGATADDYAVALVRANRRRDGR